MNQFENAEAIDSSSPRSRPLTLAHGAPAFAQAAASFPSKSITIIVPATPGGAIDLVARLTGDQMIEGLGQARRHRQQGRRDRHHRHAGRRHGRAGRPHARAGREQPRHQPDACSRSCRTTR